MAQNVAIVAGASGLTGQYLVPILLEDAFFDSIVTIGRRFISINHPRLIQRTVDFNTLSPDDLTGGTHLFCALGTTIKKAGSEAAFRAVDYEAVLNFARVGVAVGAQRFIVVSSVSAAAKSSNFYLRVKGEMERDVATLPYEAVHIFRPSVLLGARAEQRPGEAAGIAVARAVEWMMVGPIRKYRAISAARVAQAMASAAERGAPGVHRHEFDDIERLAQGV